MQISFRFSMLDGKLHCCKVEKDLLYILACMCLHNVATSMKDHIMVMQAFTLDADAVNNPKSSQEGRNCRQTIIENYF